MKDSIRPALLANDPLLLSQILGNLTRVQDVQKVQISDMDGRVKASGEDEVRRLRGDDLGCQECHRLLPQAQPRAVHFPVADGVLRMSMPIANEPACLDCHVQEASHLGMLVVDVSLSGRKQDLLNRLRIELLVSVGVTILVTWGLYVLIHRLVVRRVEVFRRPLLKFAAGDFASRLPVSSGLSDELGELAKVFNHMAGELERYIREQEERSELRQRTIIEERERIARELHDGLGQLLGYVNTKTMAVRLLLKKRQIETASKHLLQLEESARDLFLDMREAILGLKTAGQIGLGLGATLRDFVSRFEWLGGMSVELSLPPDVERLALTGEVELQLLRIVQEALVNARKHSSASEIRVTLEMDDEILNLTIADDGRGFDPKTVRSSRNTHFGLCIMMERAEAIGAEFNLESEPGGGTRITVRLPP